MKKDNLSQFVESIEKKIIEKNQIQDQKKTKSTLKLQQGNNYGVDHGKANATDGHHSGISSVEDIKKNMVVGRGLIEQVDKNKNASKSLLQKQRKDVEKNNKQIKQKLLKMSTAKALSNKPQHATSHPYNPYNTLLDSQSQSPSKIQENNQKTLQYSRLFSKGQNELKQSIQWKNGQRERLKLYFKHHCQLIKYYPKLSTFEHVQTIFNTLNVTEWMVFCKNLGIGCRIKVGHPEGLRILSCLFKKYEDSDKRVTYDKFQILVAEVVLYMAEEELVYLRSEGMSQQQYEQLKKQKIEQIIDWMNLNDSKKQKKKLKQIGIMCSQQVYSIPKQGQQSQRKPQNKKTNSLLQSRLQRPSMPILNSNTTNTTSSKPQKLPKVYRNFIQRKQSKLMHNLVISNIDKIIPTDDTKNFLQNYIGINDIYLKQYFKKQNQVKSGLLNKLEVLHRVDYRKPGYEASKGKSLGKLYFR